MLGTHRKAVKFFRAEEDPSLRSVYCHTDPELFSRIPYVAKILHFRQGKTSEQKKSPLSIRKNVKVNMKCDKNFINWGIHFSGPTFEALRQNCVEILEREMEQRKARYVELGFGKFFNSAECIMMRVRIYKDDSIEKQFNNTAELFMKNNGQVRQYLLFPPPF